MPSTPSFLLSNDSGNDSDSNSTPPQPPKRGLTTGRKILAYPNSDPAAMRSAVRSLGNLSPLKPANVASASDFTGTRSISPAQIFQEASTHAIMYEEIGVLVVKDASFLQGFSPASIGPSGQMPIIGDDYYVYPVSEGSSGPEPVDLHDLLGTLQKLTASLQQRVGTSHVEQARSAGARPTEVLAPASTSGNQKTWGLNAIQALTSKFTGKNVRVAVIDTGIDPNHPDLSSRIAAMWAFDGGSANDDVGHGTHVAGTIAGARSGLLAYGVAPEVQLYIAKVFRTDGTGGTSVDLVAAVNWALQQKCQIANMSLSSNQILPPGTHFDPAFETLAQTALNRGLLLIAASGNLADTGPGGRHPGVRNNPPAPIGYPANCPSVLAVGALNQNLQISSFSNAGQSDPSNGQINFAAPGEDVVSSWPTNLPVPQGQQVPGLAGSYALDSGTSMAAPHVSGLAALLSEKLSGTGGLALFQALPLNPVNQLTGQLRSDVGFGMPLAPQS